MERIAVDMDGVLADTTVQFFDFDERDFGKRRPFEEIIGKPESVGFPNAQRYVHTKDFFRTAPVMKGSQAVLSDLNKRYEVFIVSAAVNFRKVSLKSMNGSGNIFLLSPGTRLFSADQKRSLRPIS